MAGHTQAQDLVEECSLGLTPVLHMLDELVSREKVRGSVDNSTISDVSGLVTVRLAAGKLAAELSRVDGRGAEGTVTTLPNSLLYTHLDGLFQFKSLFNL